MTEDRWRACSEPRKMLDFLRGRLSDRQLRLFACACCRAVGHLVPPGPCQAAVEVALRYADGDATPDELAAARSTAVVAAGRAGPRSAAAWAACEAANPDANLAARAASEEALEQLRRANPETAAEEAEAQAGYLRDIVGDPFRRAWVAPLRRLGKLQAVRDVAEELYAGAPHEDMAVLADALERAGCGDAAVLEHCRSDGPHVRGCWVVDAVLGHGSCEATPEPAEQPAAGPSTATAAAGSGAVAEPHGAGRAPRGHRGVLTETAGGGFVVRWGAGGGVPTGPAGDGQSPERSESEARVSPVTPEELRTALARHLSEKPYRRFLREALDLHLLGRKQRPRKWDAFARDHPEYKVSYEEFIAACRVCWVHGCDVAEATVAGPSDPPGERSPEYLRTRGTLFPYSHRSRDPSGPGPQRVIWWCPECQRAREEWERTRG